MQGHGHTRAGSNGTIDGSIQKRISDSEPGSSEYVNVIAPEEEAGSTEAKKTVPASLSPSAFGQPAMLSPEVSETQDGLAESPQPRDDDEQDFFQDRKRVHQPRRNNGKVHEVDDDDDIKMPGSFDMYGPSGPQHAGGGGTWADMFRKMTLKE